MNRALFACIIALLTACSEQPRDPGENRPGGTGTEEPTPDKPTTPEQPDRPATPPDVEPTHTTAIYVHNFDSTRVDIDIYEAEGEYFYAVKGAGFERYITVGADKTVTTADAGGIQSFATAAEEQKQLGLWPDPILSTEGSISDAGSMISFGYVDSGGKANIDYLILYDTSEWVDTSLAIFTDAWVLPFITFKAVKYPPADNPWRVWMQRSTTTPGIYRIIDLYRGACPLADANATHAGDIITIDATNPSDVVLGPSSTAFVCPGIEPVTVSATGIFSGHSFSFETPFGRAEIRLQE